MNPDHLFSFRRISDVQLNADGDSVAYVVEYTDAAADRECSAIWIAPLPDGSPRQLSPSGTIASSPSWSPDGTKLAYLCVTDDVPQLFVVSVPGGTPRQLTHRPHGAGTAVWAPDGSSLLFSAPVEIETRPPGMDPERWKLRPKVVRRSRYKEEGSGYLMWRKVCIFSVAAAGGDWVQLTDSDGDDSGPCFSPDGRSIAFARTRPGPAEGHFTDLFRYDLDERRVRRLTRSVGSAMSPAWSPDGRSIAFYGACDPGDSMLRVWVVSAGGQQDERPLTSPDVELASFPLSVTSPPHWVADSRHVMALLADRGATRIARLAVGASAGASGSEEITSPEVQVMAFSANRRADRVAHVWCDPQQSGGLCWTTPGSTTAFAITDVNADWGGRALLPAVVRRLFPRADGGETEGWLFVPGRTHLGRRPLLVHVHGGPGSFAEFDYAYHPHWSELVSRGWFVLSLNTVGSSSYTREFFEALRGHWGERDLPDTLAAVDALVQEGRVDPQRVAVSGKSYGGFLAAYAVAHSSRFAAAVLAAPVLDLQSHWGTSDSGYYVDSFDMKGQPWEARDTYLRLSPFAAVDRIRTPTIILQGEADLRCPLGQSEQLFQGMMRVGLAPTELVLYPGGDHHFPEAGRPSHRLDYWQRVIAWLERWC